jgi:NAD(P)-dependent dehydrogenase (short-subunit alcohol dehydrogenase family)
VVDLFEERGAICEVTIRGDGPVGRERVKFHVVDVTDEQAVTRFYASIPDLWASLHLAGAFAGGPVDRTSAADVRKMFETNAMSCFLCCREAIKAVRRFNRGEGGRIVNVSSKPAVVPAGGMIAYTTSKAAVASITQCLAEEVKPEGIWVNAVVPSTMDTPANRKAMPDADHSKWPKVEEVAQAIAFLASADNALTSGALVPVYGKT